MTDRLKALVIGGSGALGSEICRVLAGKGFDVVFTYHLGEERANGLSTILEEREGMGCALRLDLNHIEEARAAVAEANEKLGGMDALVIASGLAIGEKGRRRPPKFLEITPEGYDRMSDVNVRGVLFVCQEAARIMAAAGGGKIVIVGSI
ncbi:MAG: SDR family oxidoreductase, partial [Desulfobacterales bacterium]|nr:SDR family oxidoreductase [Desulfobacterales bacterium]